MVLGEGGVRQRAQAAYSLLADGAIPVEVVGPESAFELLEEAGWLVPLDWKEAPEDASSRIQVIAERRGLSADAACAACEVDGDQLDVWLRDTADRLAGHGLVLADIAQDVDDHALVVVAQADAATVAELVDAAFLGRWTSLAPPVSARAPATSRKRRRRSCPAIAPSRDELLASAEHYIRDADERAAIYAAAGPVPAGISVRHALVGAGCALASAGEPPDSYQAPWRRAGQALRYSFMWQAERYHYVAPGFDDTYVLAAAFLAGTEADVLGVLRSHPLLEEQGVAPRHGYFQRLVLDGFTGTVAPTDAERADLAKYADLAALAAAVEATSDDDTASFATFLTRWLRTSWASTDRAMRREAKRGEHPYCGPISPVACALCARLAHTPPLADDVAPYVDERVVATARQLHSGE